MVAKSSKLNKNVACSTRELLLRAAKGLFSCQGFDGTSVKAICDRADVNVSLVSYHFKGKEGLLRSCLEAFGAKKLVSFQRILQSPQTADELRVRLQMFVDEILDTYLQEPDVVRIIHRESEMNRELTQDIFKGTFHQLFQTLVDFMKAAQKKGLIRKELNSQYVAMLFFGALVHLTRIDLMNERVLGVSLKDPKFRKGVSDHLLSMFLEGFSHREGEARV